MNPTTVWGIDVSTKRIALAATDGRTLSADIPRGLTGAERLWEARSRVWFAAREFAADSPPLCVWVERPTGAHPSPALMQMMGVVSEAVFASLRQVYRYPVSVHPIAVSQWKKAVLGKGNASKEDVENWGRDMARKFDWDQYPANQDEYDALAIAFAGRSMISESAGSPAVREAAA